MSFTSLRQPERQEILTLVSIVGREGAAAALTSSTIFGTQQLAEFAESIGLRPLSRDSKSKLALDIVRALDKRITKPLDELKTMTKDQIMNYLESVHCDTDEVVELLST